MLRPPLHFLLFIGLILTSMTLASTPAMDSQARTRSALLPGADFGSGLAICPPPIAPVTLSNPTVITNCTQAGIQAALNGGGQITFDCGPDPVTIPLTSVLTTNGSDTVLDGGGLVTLDGQNLTKILFKPFSPNENTLTIQHLRFINGRAPATGGLAAESGAAITSGSPGTRLHVINSTFENNGTSHTNGEDNQGGAIFSNNSYETIISGSVFTNNSAGNGGAIGGLATGMIIYNSRFTNNRAVDTTAGGIVRGYGGALHLDGVANDFNPNSNKTLHICGAIFEGNSAVRGGGATASVVSDNLGTKATFERSTFTNNEVTGLAGSYGQGGAIYHIEDEEAGAVNEDNLAILQSTFSGNKALRQGGGVWVQILGRGQVANSTFAGNTTTAPLNEVGQGGAMAITKGIIEIINSTFANNHAAYQAGAIHGGGANDPNRVITLKNTIFFNNTLNEQDLPSETRWQGYHTNRPLADGGQNIQFPRFKPTYNNDVNNNITANPIYLDPRLNPLANNGGFNQTLALQAGSPAINTGAAGCPSTDQRDAPRVGQCDIGAYEFGSLPPIANSLLLTKQAGDLNGTLPYTQTIAYTIRLENRDTAPAQAVVLTDTLPGTLTFGGWVQPDSATLSPPATITWGPQDLPAGGGVTLIFTATINPIGGDPPLGQVITNTAYYSAGNGDAGTATAVFTVGDDPDKRVFVPVVVK